MNAEEVELLSDSKYRNYVAAVDKALKNFEYSSEWADLISALGKLNKVNVGRQLPKAVTAPRGSRSVCRLCSSDTFLLRFPLRPNLGTLHNSCLLLRERKHRLCY